MRGSIYNCDRRVLLFRSIIGSICIYRMFYLCPLVLVSYCNLHNTVVTTLAQCFTAIVCSKPTAFICKRLWHFPRISPSVCPAAYQRVRAVPDARHDAALLRETPGQDQGVHAEGDGAAAAARQVHHRGSVVYPSPPGHGRSVTPGCSFRGSERT